MLSVMARADDMDQAGVETIAAALRSRIDAPREWSHTTTVRARYAGQGHELDIHHEEWTGAALTRMRFEALHETLFGYKLDRPVELVSARYAAAGSYRDVHFARAGSNVEWSATAPFDSGGPLAQTVDGAMSIALPDATLYVAPKWRATS